MSNTGPAHNGKVITPDDANPIAHATRAIWVGTEGDVRVTTFNEDDITLKAVPAGTMLPIRVTKVWATGTSAGALVGLW